MTYKEAIKIINNETNNNLISVWKVALQQKDSKKISHDIHYGFSKYDLKALEEIYKKCREKMRDKIEYILTDCNFHYECGLLIQKNYKEFELSLEE